MIQAHYIYYALCFYSNVAADLIGGTGSGTQRWGAQSWVIQVSLKVLIRDRQEGQSQRNRGDDGTSGQKERQI